jgi:hypothetical protein
MKVTNSQYRSSHRRLGMEEDTEVYLDICRTDLDRLVESKPVKCPFWSVDLR